MRFDERVKSKTVPTQHGGIRYTVQINGQEKYLFNEGSKWFVEARA